MEKLPQTVVDAIEAERRKETMLHNKLAWLRCFTTDRERGLVDEAILLGAEIALQSIPGEPAGYVVKDDRPNEAQIRPLYTPNNPHEWIKRMEDHKVQIQPLYASPVPVTPPAAPVEDEEALRESISREIATALTTDDDDLRTDGYLSWRKVLMYLNENFTLTRKK